MALGVNFEAAFLISLIVLMDVPIALDILDLLEVNFGF